MLDHTGGNICFLEISSPCLSSILWTCAAFLFQNCPYLDFIVLQGAG